MEERIEELETSELEGGPEGIGADGYTQLLALYLATGQIPHTKFLWKRIPASMKNGNEELAALWNVGQTLWQKDTKSFHKSIRVFQWTPNIAPVITKMVQNVRDATINLIGNGYTCITVQDAGELLGMTEAEISSQLLTGVGSGWTLQNGFIYPTEPQSARFPPMSAEDQISRLTDYVSVLEN